MPTVYVLASSAYLKVGATTQEVAARATRVLTDNPPPDDDCASVRIVAAFPGDRTTEGVLHALLREQKDEREWYKLNARLRRWLEMMPPYTGKQLDGAKSRPGRTTVIAVRLTRDELAEVARWGDSPTEGVRALIANSRVRGV